MSQRKLQDGLANLGKALANLERAITLPREQELVIEGTIQRFETTIEIFWNVLRRALEMEGFVIRTPRESLKNAFAIGWLDNEQRWLDMLASRNTTSHQYLDEKLIDRNYEDIKRNVPTLRAAFDLLRSRYPAGLNS